MLSRLASAFNRARILLFARFVAGDLEPILARQMVLAGEDLADVAVPELIPEGGHGPVDPRSNAPVPDLRVDGVREIDGGRSPGK